jgi:hypothetical protein
MFDVVGLHLLEQLANYPLADQDQMQVVWVTKKKSCAAPRCDPNGHFGRHELDQSYRDASAQGHHFRHSGNNVIGEQQDLKKQRCGFCR